MKRNINNYFKFCLVFFSLSPVMAQRSNLRPYDGSPIITTNWIGKKTINSLEDSHLEAGPIFKTFDPDYFYAHMLPTTSIPLRYNPEKTVDPEILTSALDNLFYEVRSQEKKFTDFEVLKKDGFNIKKQAGLLVLKGKEFPLNQFVVKLFMETPRSFIRAYNKGFIAACHFIIGHGATRYMLGFTRLKNLDVVRNMINDDPYWSEKVDMPRKWFWLPEGYPWIHFTGHYISGYDQIELDAPGAYAIIEDAINVEYEFSIKKKEDRIISVQLCNFLHCQIDPHSNNFVLEKDTGKIIIIDTEHLPTMVSLKEPVHIESYRQWYTHLISQGISEYFWRPKAKRKELQLSQVHPYQGPEKYRTPETTIFADDTIEEIEDKIDAVIEEATHKIEHFLQEPDDIQARVGL